MKSPTYKQGFTLIEMFVVLAIVAILTTVVLVSLNDTKNNGEDAATMRQLEAIEAAITQLVLDTGKGPNGCPFGTVANAEARINDNQAGLLERPDVQDNGGNCEWTAADVAKWRGPYLSNEVGFINRYEFRFDPDYPPYANCPTEPQQPLISVIHSRGEDAVSYSCDDVWIELTI